MYDDNYDDKSYLEIPDIPKIGTPEELRVDNSKRSDYCACPRKFFYRHVAGLQSQSGSTALRAGSTIHAMLEGFYSHIKLNGWNDIPQAVENGVNFGRAKWDAESDSMTFFEDYRTFQACFEVFFAYTEYFQTDETNVEVVETEKVVACPITLDTEEERRLFGHLPPITLTGKIDLQLKLSDMKWINDFKTTGGDLNKQTHMIRRSPQGKGYSFGAKHSLDYSAEGMMFTHLFFSSRKNKNGDYGKLFIDFRRTPQIYSEDDLLGWKRSFLHTVANIYRSYTTGEWPMVEDRCYDFQHDCTYTRLCEQNRFGEEIKEGYVYRKWDVENE